MQSSETKYILTVNRMVAGSNPAWGASSSFDPIRGCSAPPQIGLDAAAAEWAEFDLDKALSTVPFKKLKQRKFQRNDRGAEGQAAFCSAVPTGSCGAPT